MAEEVKLTAQELAGCKKDLELYPQAQSWCWIDGSGRRVNGFKSPEEALLEAKKNKATEPIAIRPLNTKAP